VGPVARTRSAFGWLWGSSTLSALADGLYLIALPLIAVQLTDSPALIAGVRVAQTAAGFAFGLIVGVLVDRFDRRRLMMLGELVRGGAMVGVAAMAATGALTIAVVFAAAFVVGTAEVVTDTAAQALVPMVVDRQDLRRANGRLMGGQMVMNDFLGAPLGAVLVGVATTVALIIPAGLYLLAAIALAALSGREYVAVRTGTTTVRADVREGLVALWSNTTLRRLAVFGAVSTLTNTAFFAVFLVFALSPAMGLSGFEYSLLLTAAAVGAVSGSLAADRLGERLRPRVLLSSVVAALALCFATPVVTVNPFLIAGALVVSGVVTATGAVVSMSLRQSLAPENLLGRISAANRLLALGASPVGALLGGIIAQATSPRVLFILLAAGVLTALPLTWGVPAADNHRRDDRTFAEDDPAVRTSRLRQDDLGETARE
jgi:MFS family permease